LLGVVYSHVHCLAGPDLPTATEGGKMVPTPLGGGVVFVGGSSMGNGLYELKCGTNLSCKWVLMSQKLRITRKYPVVILVPDSMVDCEK
jgi:hypothetical protein